jgi:hypothetical protein
MMNFYSIINLIQNFCIGKEEIYTQERIQKYKHSGSGGAVCRERNQEM